MLMLVMLASLNCKNMREVKHQAGMFCRDKQGLLIGRLLLGGFRLLLCPGNGVNDANGLPPVTPLTAVILSWTLNSVKCTTATKHKSI